MQTTQTSLVSRFPNERLEGARGSHWVFGVRGGKGQGRMRWKVLPLSPPEALGSPDPRRPGSLPVTLSFQFPFSVKS